MDTLMVHSISSSTQNNAAKSSLNSIQGHYHGTSSIVYFADTEILRWSMTVGCLIDIHSPAARYGAKIILKRPVLGCGVILSNEGNWLVISDLHVPYHHKDALDFLDSVRQTYDCQPDRILNVGDLFDHHRGSYHESEPDALDSETEYYRAQETATDLQELFPSMVITCGNHDLIPQRKMKSIGLPPSMLSNYNRLYGLKKSWVWVDRLKFDSGAGSPLLVPMVLNKKGRWNKKL